MVRPFLLSLSLALTVLTVPVAHSAQLLVGNKSADTVWRLSTGDGKELGEFATGQGPHEIVVAGDGRTALVSNYGAQSPGNTLSVLDLAGGAPVRSVDLGENTRPHGMRWLPGNRRAVVTTEGSRRLLVVDIAAGKVESAIDLGEGRGHMVALSADGAIAYVTKIDAGTVSRLDLKAGRKTQELAAGAGAEGVAVHPGSGEVWVSNREAGTVTVHDPATLAVTATVSSPGFPIRVVFSPDGRFALATNARAATLSVIDAASKRVTHTVPLSRKDAQYSETMLGRAALPIGVIADPGGKRVYVAISGGDEIAVVDTASWRVVDHWKTGREPDALGMVP